MNEWWQENAFLWTDLPSDIKWAGNWADYEKLPNVPNVQYLIVWRHKTRSGDLDNFAFPEGLKYLELNWSNCRNVSFVPKSLRRLEAHYCTKLESARAIASNAEALEFLHFNRCKKFTDYQSLTEFRRLKVLRLNSCGDVPNLSFLLSLPRLEDFRFVNTNVLDGDLGPILRHPTIRSIGSLDKKHYSHKVEELEQLLAQKR